MDDEFLPPESMSDDELTLRTWLPGDGEVLAATTTASYDHLHPWMAWATPDDTAAAAEVRVRDFYAQYLRRENFVVSVWVDDELVGGTGFHPRWGGVESGIAEIGMWIAADRAGQGLGTRVLRTMVDWGLSDSWCWNRFVWCCHVDNRASARTAEKAGFTLEGTLRGPGVDGSGTGPTHVFGFNRGDLASRT